MAIGDVYKLAVVGAFGLGQEFVNTFHYRCEDAGAGDFPSDLALSWQLTALPNYLDLLMDSSLVVQIEVRQVTGSPLASNDLVINETGANSGEQLPPQVCPLVSWRTGLIGRRNRGRSYLPAPPENIQDAGALTTGFLESIQTFADSCKLLTGGGFGDWQLVIYGKANPDAEPPLDENIVPVTTALVRRDLATQRRRRVGAGS